MEININKKQADVWKNHVIAAILLMGLDVYKRQGIDGISYLVLY